MMIILQISLKILPFQLQKSSFCKQSKNCFIINYITTNFFPVFRPDDAEKIIKAAENFSLIDHGYVWIINEEAFDDLNVFKPRNGSFF
jgi:hypothetical protein